MAVNGTELTEELASLLNTIWTPEEFTVYYDEAYCLANNVTYSHRVDAENVFNFCSVPESGADAFLFASLALLVASVCMGKLQSVWVLIIGGCLGILNYEVNLYRLGNAISLWLGIQPPDLFFYAFLPPLLVDAALRLDWYLFSKLWPHIVLMAYAMVLINATVLAPFILFVLGFSSRGWNWLQGAVLAAMLAPTDAVAVTAILKAGGGPEGMVVIMEGEALLNDASAVTLYTVFLHILMSSGEEGVPSVPSEIWPIIRDILKLTGIGVGVGLAFAWVLGYMLRLLRWRGVQAFIESLVVLATAYLAFYVAQGPCKGSGVIAVCIFGLYGSATGHWGMLATDAESGVHEAVWDTVAFAANSLVFFWSGISSVNFVARCGEHENLEDEHFRRAAPQLNKSAWNYAVIPIIYLFMYGFRGVCLLAFNPLFKLLGKRLTLPETAFATVAGLRGSLTLIMAADFIIHSDFYSGGAVDEANFDVVLWASAFVLLSLLINAPSIGPVMRWTGLSRISPEKVRGRKRALEELDTFTAASIAELKQQQDGEFLQGANWTLVAAFVDHTCRLKHFLPKPRSGGSRAGGQAEALGAEAADAVTANGVAAAGEAAGSAGAIKRRGSMHSVASGDADEMEVPFMPSASAAHAGASTSQPHELNVAALRVAARGGLGSFYDPTDVAAAAAATAAAVAVSSALAGHAPRGAPVSTSLPGSFVGVDGEEEVAVDTLFSQEEEQRSGAAADFDARWQQSLGKNAASAQRASADSGPMRGVRFDVGGVPGEEEEPAVATAAAAHAAGAAAQMVRRHTVSRAAAASRGSDRDLLGRLQGAPAAPLSGGPSSQGQTMTAALLSRVPSKVISRRLLSMARGDADVDLETGGAAGAATEDGSPKEDGSGGASSEAGAPTLQELRLRVLNGIKRHFRAKRLGGLLSPEGLRIAIYACDTAIERAEHNPDEPLRLWEILHKEISGTRVTHAVAGVLACTLRFHRGAAGWWRTITSVPFRLFTGLLRRHLGSKMLIACEVTVELYMGLAASPQMQWVYFDEEAPVEVLEEVQGQLGGAYTFIQDREAEAPAQYRAVQSYRAAMAVLRQQRAFIASLYERGAVDEEEREELGAAVDGAMRQLDMTGPHWRPPSPLQVVRSLDAFSAAPADLVAALVQQAALADYQPEELVWASQGGGGDGAPAAGGFYLVVSGVVRQRYEPPDGKATETLQGVGAIFGVLPGLCGARLPGAERIVACGNSFGRGPLIYHFPASAVDMLRQRAASGDAAAEALETAMFRVAALHVVQHVQGDLQAIVKAYLLRHRPLTKYTAGASAQQQLMERAGRYMAQVLLDVLQGMPSAVVVRLGSMQHYSQHAHVLLLQGSLAAPAAVDPLVAPAVLPWMSTVAASWYGSAGGGPPQQQPIRVQAGVEGATLVVCASTGAAGHLGSMRHSMRS